MGKFTGKLLVSDMDATLLDSRGGISVANREAIEYFISESGDIYAVGDNMNDIDMLRVAGHSYAVANAEAAVKAEAGHSAPSCDDDAVAYIVNEAGK